MLLDKYLSRLSETRKKIFLNVFWAMLGKVVTLMSTLFVGVLVARYLGPKQYGLMNYIISSVGLYTVFSTFGTTEIIIRELSKKDLPATVILGTSFIVRLALAILTLFAIGIYLFLSDEPVEVSGMILIYSSSIIFTGFDVIRHYFTSIIQNEYVVKSEIVRTIIGAGIKIVLLLLKAPLVAFVAALAFDFVLLASGYVLAYRKKVGRLRDWKFDKHFVKTLLSTSFPLVISSAAAIIYGRIDQVMISKMIDNESLGYFSTAVSFIGILTFIPGIIIQTVSPLLVKYRKEDTQRYELESQRMMNIATWSTMALCILISFLSYYIIKYTYGMDYMASVPVMQILTFKAVGIALATTGGQLIIIENIHQLAFIRNILTCIVCIVCNYFLIPQWGIIGSAWATIITVMFSGGLANLFIPSYHHILKKQCIALFGGWKDLVHIGLMFRK